MTVVEALAEAISFENEDTTCLFAYEDGSPDEDGCSDRRCHEHGCMVARVNRWRAALASLSPESMKASPSAQAIQTLDNLTWQPPPDDGSGLLAAAQVNNSIEATLVEPPPKPEADLIQRLRAHIADLYIERDQARAELAEAKAELASRDDHAK